MKTYFVFLFLIFAVLNIYSSKPNDYELLLEWGKNYSVYISDKIDMNYTNENNKNYYVKEEIKKDEIVMTIPKKVLLNIDSAINILGKKIKKQFEIYKNKQLEDKTNLNEDMLYHINQSFLAYLMTIANKNKSKNNKNKLYQYYKYYFNTFETNLEKYPLFFSTEQMRLLAFSIFGSELISTRRLFEEEYEILQREIHKKILDQDEYIKYRIFTFNKFVNMTGTSYIIPFVDMLDTNPINFNLQLNYTEDSVSLVSTKDIHPGDVLSMAVVQMSNSGFFITYGKVFEENKYFVENFRIHKIGQNFLREQKLDPLMATGEIIDITEKNYYEKVIPDYIEISKALKEDGSKASALRLFLENIKSIRESYNKITVSDLFKNFFNAKTVQNIRSVLDTEKYYLDKKIREMKKIVNKYARERQHDL